MSISVVGVVEAALRLRNMRRAFLNDTWEQTVS